MPNNLSYEVSQIIGDGIKLERYDDYKGAIKCYKRALEISRERNLVQKQATLLVYLGNCYYMLKQYRKSIKYSEEALKISRSITDEYNEEQALRNLSDSHEGLGEDDKSTAYHIELMEK